MKILLIHASAGAGHRRAAEALRDGFKISNDHSVVLVDALDYTSRWYKYIYRTTYTFLITRIPWLWGFFFWLVDIPFLRPLIRMVRRIQNGFNGQKLKQFLVSENFDYIISTHFFSNEVAAYLKRTGKINSRILSVITDYDVHSIWIAAGIDTYAVACEHTKEKAVALGVAKEQIIVSGIPSDTKFSDEVNIRALKEKLELREGIFTVLVATGSFGIGPIEEIIDKLDDVQAMVVCGHNQKLFKALNQKTNPLLKVFGLVDNMHELMSAADCMITKPGGLSITEALVKRLPLIFFNAIPGQESHNIEVLAQYGIGLYPSGIEDIVNEVKYLASSREAFLTQKQRIESLARPSAVKTIISALS